MKQLLVDETWETGKLFSLTGKAYRYLCKVRRIVKNDELPLLTKDGVQGVGVVEEIRSDSLSVLVRMVKKEDFANSKELLPLPIIFCPSLLKGSKTDEAIRNAVQCGASQVNVIQAKHSVSEVSTKDKEARLKRYERVITEATQQSGNPYNVSVFLHGDLDQFLKSNKERLDKSLVLVFHEQNQNRVLLHEAIYNIEDKEAIFVFVGPEGGFSPQEIKLFESYNCKLIWLGPMVLRAENAATAAMSTTSLLLLERGKWHLKNENE